MHFQVSRFATFWQMFAKDRSREKNGKEIKIANFFLEMEDSKKNKCSHTKYAKQSSFYFFLSDQGFQFTEGNCLTIIILPISINRLKEK